MGESKREERERWRSGGSDEGRAVLKLAEDEERREVRQEGLREGGGELRGVPCCRGVGQGCSYMHLWVRVR